MGRKTARLTDAVAAIADLPDLKAIRRVWPISRFCGLGRPHLIVAVVDLAGSPPDLSMVAAMAKHYPVVMLGLPTFRVSAKLVRLVGAIAYHHDAAAMAASLEWDYALSTEQPVHHGLRARARSAGAWLSLRRREEPDLARVLDLTRELTKYREFLRYNRLLHDHVLQTLEMLARPESSLDASTRTQVVKDAAWLRALVESGTPLDNENRIDVALGLLVSEESADRSLRVSFRATAHTWPELSSASVSALCGATREALQNVRKHANAKTAEVIARPSSDGVELRIRDCGAGFDPAAVRLGFGLTESINGRLREAGGRASVDSAMGSGTEVSIFVPASSRQVTPSPR